MAGEVQYGGRITDDMDRRLFTAYTEAWLCNHTLSPSFSFNPESPISRMPSAFNYRIPNFTDMEEYLGFISKVSYKSQTIRTHCLDSRDFSSSWRK